MKEGSIREGLLYERLTNGAVRCGVCLRRCTIPCGQRGWCGARLNRHGRLYSLIYGRVAVQHVAPIEIKPLFHFYPGSRAFSLGSLGCNFKCPGCQNWDIAHQEPKEDGNSTRYISPEEAVRLAQKSGCQGLSWTYNEPTLWFEYTLDGARLAKRAGLYTNYVTNGYTTPEALDLIGPFLDGYRVDIKGFGNTTYGKIGHISNFEELLVTVERAKHRWKMWVEVVTNVIPGYNDDTGQLTEIAAWIVHRLGEETPWHVTRFVPHLNLSHLPPTSVETLERAKEIGHGQGLRFVYLGNVPDHPAENTYCDRCGRLLIERYHYSVLTYVLKDHACPHCGSQIPIIGRLHRDGFQGEGP
ncbi:MAG: AmmeMemoRadiSam system radical SAM enzyme [bacterium]